MKKFFLFLLTSLLVFQLDSLAQADLPQYGIYSAEERSMKECPFDKDAEAIILLDEAFSNYDDEYQLITTRRIRIKILSQRGIDKGNITIPFYTKDQFEFIRDIQGMTYTPDDDPSTIELNKKSIYTDKKNDNFSEMKFAMPDVKVGSIIEYKYESVMKHYGGLQDWLFQDELPTLRSCFRLAILPNAEFSYVVSKKSNYPVIVKPSPEQGMIYFEMSNIPGLRFEPYMDAPRDYLQRVEFQFSGFVNQLGDKQNVHQTWKAISSDLATDEDLGNNVKKNLSIPDELKLRVESQASPTDKINVIYNYVRNNFTWNGINHKYASDGIKKTWEAKTGTSAEINLILVNLLQSFKIDAYPLLVAERDFGKINPLYPLIDRFNKTIAYASVDGTAFIMDATQKYCPFDLIPYSLLNTYALVINKKTDKLLYIENGAARYSNEVTVNMKLAANGNITGRATINSMDYAKEFCTEKIKQDEKAYIKKYIETPNAPLKADSFRYENINTDTADLVQEVKFNEQVEENGGFFLLNCNLFTGLHKNIFTAAERFTNVDFGYPFRTVVNETIELPPGSKTDDLPKNKILETPDKSIIIIRKVAQTDQGLTIKFDFQQTVTMVNERDYADLKEFYKQMIDMLNEPVVVKLGK